MYQIREASVEEMLDAAGELFAAHWNEVALNKQAMVLRPDVARYEAMEEAGSLLVLAAFDHEWHIVGYSVNFIARHLHYADLCVASNDLLFVDQAHRRGRLGLQLIRATEARAKEMGVHMVLWHAKPNTALAELMPRLGYGVQDIVFSREI